MADASIPVDLFNPGQVFACLGFLEAADVLLGDAEGGFDWSDEAHVRFVLRADGDRNPFDAVLEFVAGAQLQRLAPRGYTDPPSKDATKTTKKTKGKKRPAEDDSKGDVTSDGPVCMLETFPGPDADWRALPIRLERRGGHLDVTHWCDASSRNDFKLFAGLQRAPAIARAMLEGVARLWNERRAELVADPFSETVPMGGSNFKFDARKSWTALDAGYSPDEQKHLVTASPVVEMLAAVGLEHARPDEYERRQVRYAAWSGLVPPALARPALAGASIRAPLMKFRFELALSGKNKVVTFAREETNA